VEFILKLPIMSIFSKLLILTILLTSMSLSYTHSQIPDQKVRMGIIGATHDHIGFMGDPSFLDRIEIVGVAETDLAILQAQGKRFGWSREILFEKWEKMLKKAKPEAVMVFTSPLEHPDVVRLCAPLGIHVMVEKPFAISMEAAEEMAALAKKHQIHLLTNYETTWYASNHFAHEQVQAGKIGPLRKVVVHDGHWGPKEIGCTEAFLEWLLDPIENGGGALTDFGCYGANLTTWLTSGKRPKSVFAQVNQFKTDPVYAKVDDEATILLEYEDMQAVIQASWNWPYNRKDMEVYGTDGFVNPLDGTRLRMRTSHEAAEENMELEGRKAPFNNPVTYFTAVVKGEIDPAGSLSSLENNLIVTEILTAAMQSARTGQKVKLK
ncbi:MAG: Gfo/Idh/MocA family oxidoreductase, partial [Bacteroidota bacterium]